LHGKVPYSTVYSRIKVARKNGMYNKEIRRECEKKEQKLGLNIEIPDDGTTTLRDNISPVTITTINSSLAAGGSDTTITTKKLRQSSRQASIARLDAKRVKLDYGSRYKKAFKDATNLVAVNAQNEPVHTICNRLNHDFKLDRAKRLARSTVYQAAKDGRAGMSPPSRGPAPNIPGKFLRLVATHAEVSQVGDGELKGKDFKRLIGALILGTEHETRFIVEGLWRKVRKLFPELLQAATKLTVEDARAQWTTHDNLNQWFDDTKQDLINTCLVIDEEVLGEKGAMVSEDLFREDTERRIINMDETHHDLSITGDRGGPRAVSYHNPAFQRGAARGVKSARNVTGAYPTNAAGEALPPFYIFDSSAKLWENFRVKVEWIEGLPLVTGRFGCPTIIESGSFYAVRPRGSMDDLWLNEYIEKVIVPLYPNMHKTAVLDSVTGKLNQGPVILKLDVGPGRIVSSEAILLKGEHFFECGHIILLGLPNATSVQQEMDALYGPFKSSTYSRGKKVVQQKLRARGLVRRNGDKVPPAVLKLDFNDLATIVKGTPDDEPRNKPFDSIFTKK
jgi:hypothetical protein